MDHNICSECGTDNINTAEICIKCEANLIPENVMLEQNSKFEILHAIAASLKEPDKKIKGELFSYSLGSKWDIDNEAAIDFIYKIEGKFSRKNKLHGYIIEEADGFADKLKEYISDSDEFIKLANLVMAALRDTASDSSSSEKGGNVVLIHYRLRNDESTDNLGRLLIVMVDKKGVFDFDNDLQPKKFLSIDVSALRQAAFFDLTLFDTMYPSMVGDPYLKFIQGKSTSGFFKIALGCSANVDDKKTVDEIIAAVMNFSTSINLDIATKNQVQQSVRDFMAKRAELGKSIRLDEIESEINVCLPVNSKGRGKFSEFVNVGGYKINSYFEPTKSIMLYSGNVTIKGGSNYTCKIKKSSIGKEGSNKPVKLSDDGKNFIIPVDGQLDSGFLKYIFSE
jgi:nucleoid-associated protein